MKLLIVGQVAQATGIARMTQSIAQGQSRLNETHVLGIDYNNNCIDALTIEGIILHKNPSDHEILAESRLTGLLDEICPDIVLFYCDSWFIHRFQTPLNKAKHKCITVGYIPIDGQIIQASIIKEMQYLSAIVLFTEFGRRVVDNSAKQLGLEGCIPFNSTSVISHGISSNDFYPRYGSLNNYHKRRLKARKVLFPNQPDLWDGFWVLNANRNQHRKRIDLTLSGFALFARNKPKNIRLYLHMELKAVDVDVMKMARNLGISDRLVFIKTKGGHPSVSSTSLNDIYNASDVGVNTSQGEGWGLVSCEHAATGAPQIVPDHSACSEIWEGSAELLPVVRTTNHNGILQGGEVSAYDLANTLEKLYSDSKYYEFLLERGYQKITSNTYAWDKISKDWDRLFQNIMMITKPKTIS